MNEKIKVNMLSKADSVDGQGVGSAYLEQIDLVKESNDLEIFINKKKIKDEIIHVHSVNFPYFFKLNKKKPTVCHVHFLPETLDGSIKLPKLFLWVFKKYIIKFYRRSQNIVVVNPIFIDALKKYKIDEKRITYIPNYVDKKTIYSLETSNIINIKQKYNLKEEDFVVLGVGQIQYRKGILDFVETALKNPDIKYIWAGGFSFKKISDGYKELQKIVDSPPDNVIFTGIIPRSEMNELYNIASCLFLPSYNELFPMCILEAIQVELPLVLRDVELYKPVLFDKYERANDCDNFLDIILKLKDDPNYLNEVKEKSKYLKLYYSKEKVLKKWVDYYKNIYNNNNIKKKDI